MNREGLVHELAFVDHRKKIAVTGAGLGGELTADRVFDRLGWRRSFELAVARKPGVEDRRLLPVDRSRAIRQLDAAPAREFNYQLKKKLSL
jgi:hypothetical protein